MEKKYKVRIIGTPIMKYGGQTEDGYDLDLRNSYMGKGGKDSAGELGSISKTLQPVDREEANIEAEKGETALGDFDGDGMIEHMKIAGEKHGSGGTPLSVPQGTRIFSDTKKLKIKDENILKEFNKASKKNVKKGVTPAEIAEQYDINKYKAILDNPSSDHYQKKTAQLMIENYNKKLDKLFSYQESMKGFPQGIPEQFAMGGVVPSFNKGGTKGKTYYNNENTFAEWYQNQANFYGPEGVDHFEPKLNPGNVLSAQTNVAMNNPREVIHAYRTGKLDINNAAKKNGKIPSPQDLTDEEILAQHMDNFYVKDRIMMYNKDFNSVGDKNKFIQENGLTPVGDGSDDRMYTDNIEGTPGYYNMRVNQARLPNSSSRATPPTPEMLTVQEFSPSDPGVVSVDGKIPTNSKQIQKQAPKNGQWWKQDKINALAAALNLGNIKKYLPYEPAANMIAPEFNYMSPERDLAANSEQAAIQAQMATTFAGPQRQRAVSSAIQGQAAAQAGNIISKYSNENIQLANQASQMLAQTSNQNTAFNAQRLKSLFDGNTRANARYDQEKMMAQDVLRKQLVSGVTNSQKTQWLCEMYPQYCVDKNGMMSFTKGKPNFASGKSSSPTGTPGNNYLTTYQKLKAQYPDASEDVLKEAVRQELGVGRNTDTNGDGIADWSSSAAQGNVMSILANMGR